MQMHLAFRDMESSPAVEARIRERAERLERYCDNITACRVVVESPHRHSHQGRIFRVRVDVTVPDGEIIYDTGRHAAAGHEDVYVAVRDAFDGTRRALEDFVRRRRGDVKHHTLPPTDVAPE